MNTLYVYGTLRPGKEENSFRLYGFKMFDLGWFPGIIRTNNVDPDDFVVVESTKVTDGQLDVIDSYEGYNPHDPARSLYLRKRIMDGWIYVYNRPINSETDFEVPGGDWLEYRKTGSGGAEHMIEEEEDY